MSRVIGASLHGIDGVVVEVEVGLSSQLPRIDIVGLPEASVRESAARVRSAIRAVGRRFPDRRVTVNLAPASLRKAGAGLDLAIAVGILAASGEVPGEALDGCAFVGELALDGRVRPVPGALALALALERADRRELVIAEACARQAAVGGELQVLAAPHLADVLAHLLGGEPLARVEPVGDEPDEADEVVDPGAPCLSEIRGQEHAKRALVVAAAGGHGIFLHGAPGAGKTMLAKRLPGLLPPLRRDEAIEASRIHGSAGLLTPDQALLRRRPFRAPHHTASSAGLLGGGRPVHAGEISLAHHGVLFLDELPEFDRRCLEALRQVIEDRSVAIARADGLTRLPADFMLVAAANPCPCGFLRSGLRDCRCDDAAVARYRRRLSGPLLDRIDLHVPVPPVRWRALLDGEGSGATTAELRPLVARARALQIERAGVVNARLPDRSLETRVAASASARALLARAVDRLGLSARAARRCLRVARTLADLEGAPGVDEPHVAEALGYRDEGSGGGPSGSGSNGWAGT